MSSKVIARKEQGWKVVYVLPDVCKTQVGSAVVPVPYPAYTELSDCIEVIADVRANGAPVVVFAKSKVPKTQADKAGKLLGIKSQTVEATCYPKDHSGNTRARKKWLVRDGDLFWLNGP